MNAQMAKKLRVTQRAEKRSMLGISRKDRKTSECVCSQMKVEKCSQDCEEDEVEMDGSQC